MRLTPEEELQMLEEELEILKEVQLVIVEGINDRKALNAFGVRRIITLGQPIYKVVESCKEEVAIVTDLDKEGRKLYCRLKSEFSVRGVKINDRFRKFLLKHTRLRQIEGLENYVNYLTNELVGL